MTFAGAGYSISFIDVNQDVIQALNLEGRYPVDVVSNSARDRIWIEPVQGIDGRDLEAVAREIATCDIMATAVGVRALERIVPGLLAGLRSRWQANCKQPLNIILCENLIHADTFVRDLLFRHVDEAEQKMFSERVGLVMASIGRMVPVMTPEQRLEHPLLVQVEPYDTLPIDGAAFKGPAPKIRNLVLSAPFDSIVQKKLYLHNMGHAVSAYLGLHAGYQFVYESMEDPWLYLCVQNAMIESALALYKHNADTGLQIQDLLAHINDLTYRFQNKALMDTNERVGADPARKLAPSDRLVGAASLALSMGIIPVYIGLGIAAGIHQLEKIQVNLEIDEILEPLMQYEFGAELVQDIVRTVDLIRQGTPIQELFQTAERDRSRYQMKGDTHE